MWARGRAECASYSMEGGGMEVTGQHVCHVDGAARENEHHHGLAAGLRHGGHELRLRRRERDGAAVVACEIM